MKYFYLVLLSFLISCSEKKTTSPTEIADAKLERIKINSTDSLRIIEYWKKANYSGLYSGTRQKYLDSALLIKPDSAYFWQQKAMPLYKSRKYSVGKPFLAEAAKHNPKAYLEYSGFMKCIFSKEYEESIGELLEVKKRYGASYVMDHTHDFYIGLDYLQLNQYDKANEHLLLSQKQQFKDFPNDSPEEACHYLDWFYLGIVAYELENFELAIERFTMSLKVYENFGDAMYFKAICLRNLGKLEESKSVFQLALKNNQNTINEDNVFYEVYPYQIFHKLSPMAKITE